MAALAHYADHCPNAREGDTFHADEDAATCMTCTPEERYRVEVYNRTTQEWEPAKWIKPRFTATDAYSDRAAAVMRGLTIYGDSRVTRF